MVDYKKGRMFFNFMIESDVFKKLDDNDAVSLCCVGILQLVLLGVEDRRHVPNWILRLANDRVSWDNYPWGSYVWPTLYKHLRDANVKRWQPLYASDPTNEGFAWAFKNLCDRARMEPQPSVYMLSPYTVLPPTTVLTKKRIDKTKKKGKTKKLSPLNLGNTFADENVSGDDVTITGVQQTDDYFNYQTVDPDKYAYVKKNNCFMILTDPHNIGTLDGSVRPFPSWNDVTWVYMPINAGGVHWVTGAINLADLIFYVFDSMKSSILHDDLTYTMLHEMVLKKFNLEANYPLNLSAKLSSIDDNFDISDDNEVQFFVECACNYEDEVAQALDLAIRLKALDEGYQFLNDRSAPERTKKRRDGSTYKNRRKRSFRDVIHCPWCVDSYVRELSMTITYNRCGTLKGLIQGNKSDSCRHGWKQPNCANCFWYMQRGNRHAAIALVVQNEFPLAYHAVCCRHLMMNLSLKRDKTKALFWKICKAYTTEDFSSSMSHLHDIQPDAYDKLCQVGPQRWSRAHCPLVRYNYLTSNSVESVNACTVLYRKLLVLKLAETYRAMVQDWYYKRRQLAGLVPLADALQYHNHVITNYTSDGEDNKREVTQNDYTFNQMVEWAKQEHYEDEETKLSCPKIDLTTVLKSNKGSSDKSFQSLKALDEEALLEEQILTLMHRFADRFTDRRVEINNLMVLQDHPLIDYGKYALGCITGADMKNITTGGHRPPAITAVTTSDHLLSSSLPLWDNRVELFWSYCHRHSPQPTTLFLLSLSQFHKMACVGGRSHGGDAGSEPPRAPIGYRITANVPSYAAPQQTRHLGRPLAKIRIARYFYGVVLLELITRKKAGDQNSFTDEGLDIVRWVQSGWNEKNEIEVVVDKGLYDDLYDSAVKREQVTQVLQLALSHAATVVGEKRPPSMTLDLTHPVCTVAAILTQIWLRHAALINRDYDLQHQLASFPSQISITQYPT
ncbi:transposase, MuDR, MULE transposase domain protein [Tanacetum coccineum]